MAISHLPDHLNIQTRGQNLHFRDRETQCHFLLKAHQVAIPINSKKPGWPPNHKKNISQQLVDLTTIIFCTAHSIRSRPIPDYDLV